MHICSTPSHCSDKGGTADAWCAVCSAGSVWCGWTSTATRCLRHAATCAPAGPVHPLWRGAPCAAASATPSRCTSPGARARSGEGPQPDTPGKTHLKRHTRKAVCGHCAASEGEAAACPIWQRWKRRSPNGAAKRKNLAHCWPSRGLDMWGQHHRPNDLTFCHRCCAGQPFGQNTCSLQLLSCRCVISHNDFDLRFRFDPKEMMHVMRRRRKLNQVQCASGAAPAAADDTILATAHTRRS